MNDYITPNYETITKEQKETLLQLMNSTIINGFNDQDFRDILRVISRVIDRLEAISEDD